jgi:hypothetical protein
MSANQLQHVLLVQMLFVMKKKALHHLMQHALHQEKYVHRFLQKLLQQGLQLLSFLEKHCVQVLHHGYTMGL